MLTTLSGHGRDADHDLGLRSPFWERASAVEPLQVEREAGVVHDREAHVPPVLLGLGAARRGHLVHVGPRQDGLGPHEWDPLLQRERVYLTMRRERPHAPGRTT